MQQWPQTKALIDNEDMLMLQTQKDDRDGKRSQDMAAYSLAINENVSF